MANRDLTNFRTVTSQVVENKNEFLQTGAQITEAILRQGQEAKITEGLSQAQLDLAALENQYRIDFEGDPLGGMSKFKEQRQKIFDDIGKNVSPLYRRQWEDSTRQITIRNDATQQAWALKQTRVNTVNSVNTSIKNGLKQTYANGEKFGLSDEAEIEAFVDYMTSAQNLNAYASRNLGSETASSLFENYDEDNLKQFVSGVAQTNPAKALKLMDSDLVKDMFSDKAQYQKMRNAVAERAFSFEKINIEQDALNALTSSNELYDLASSGEVSGYANLKTALEASGASKAAQDLIMQRSGYSEGGAKKLNPAEQLNYKVATAQAIQSLAKKDNVSAKDIGAIQDMYYKGMLNGSYTEKEATDQLSSFIQPMISAKSDDLSKFNKGTWNPFKTDFGYDAIEKVTESFRPVDGDGKTIKDDDLGSINSISFNQKRLDIYNSFDEALKKNGINAESLGVMIPSEKRKRLAKAQNEALVNFWEGQYPSLAGKLSENPVSSIIDQATGRKIPTGLVSLAKENEVTVDIPEGTPNVTMEEAKRMEKSGFKGFVIIDGRKAEIK